MDVSFKGTQFSPQQAPREGVPRKERLLRSPVRTVANSTWILRKERDLGVGRIGKGAPASGDSTPEGVRK